MSDEDKKKADSSKNPSIGDLMKRVAEQQAAFGHSTSVGPVFSVGSTPASGMGYTVAPPSAEPVPLAFSIKDHGDHLEKWAYADFLQAEFPAYEEFWMKQIAPLTNRVKNVDDIRAMQDAELATTPYDEKDVLHSQLHYTVLRHLVHCKRIRAVAVGEPDVFTDYMVRLSSALDPADELLERFTNRGAYAAWRSRDSKNAREAWRSNANTHRPVQTKPVRDYRNRLLHGQINPSIFLRDGNNMPVLHAVRLDKQDNHLDWRVFLYDQTNTQDFAQATDVMDEAWKVVIDYLQAYWKAHLL